MTNCSVEDIKRVLNQINALILASGENIVLTSEFSDKFAEISTFLKDSNNPAFQSISEKINELIESEEDKSSELNCADISVNIRTIVAEIEKATNDSPPNAVDDKTQQNKNDSNEFITVSEDDYELYDDFITECREHLQSIEDGVITLENNTEDKELINSIFRSFHTIKGNSAFLNLKTMNVLAHRSENLLDALRNNEITYSASLTDIILEAVDLLKTMLTSLQESLKLKEPFTNEADTEQLIKKIEEAISGSSSDCGEDNKQKDNEASKKNENPEAISETSLKNEEQAKQFVLLSDETDKSFLSDFITECSEYADSAENALLELESDPTNKEAVNTIFRAFHTTKGTSSFLGIEPISELSHKVESLFIPIRDGKISFSEGYADLALRSIDLLKELIQLIQDSLGGATVKEPADYSDILKRLEEPEQSLSKPKDEEGHIPKVGEILVGEGKISKEDLETVASVQSDEPLGVKLIKSGVASVKDVAKALRKQRKITEGLQLEESSVRVRTDRLDRLIDMVGELVISHSMVAQDSLSSATTGNSGLQKKISHTGKIVRELQDLTLAIRMVPMKPTFQKMARLVRDLSRKSKKTVNFVTNGEETEIDRHMVDIINDPLVHLLRNAVDHGIESKEKREQSKKKEEGTVTLSAHHSGGSIVIEITDDGDGLDRRRIVEKAKDKGIISKDDNMSDSEIFNLIFEPGFSTAKEVTDISGRGVGLDVVKKGIESLRGKINILSEKGKGCTFIIHLPLTMAITDGMLIKVGSQRFVIPTISISMNFRSDDNMISTISGKGEIIKLKDCVLPMFRLSKIFGISDAVESNLDGIIVIINDDHCSYALAVDELLGQQQVVTKALGGGIDKISAISGGAILADGKVGLILDPSGLLEMAKGFNLEQTV